MKYLSDNTDEAAREALQCRILEATLRIFNEKGMKFTMNDLADALGMSKKTLYTVFRAKDELLTAMVDYMFDTIKKSELAIVQNTNLTVLEKIRAILGVLPESYKEINLEQLYILRDKYPDIYKRVEERLESGWELTNELLEQGMQQGVIRNVNLSILKMMMEASLEQFFKRDILIANGFSYKEGLDEVVHILLKGIESHG